MANRSNISCAGSVVRPTRTGAQPKHEQFRVTDFVTGAVRYEQAEGLEGTVTDNRA